MADRHGPRKLGVIDIGDREIRSLVADRSGRGLKFTHAQLIVHRPDQDVFANPEIEALLQNVSHHTPYVSIVAGGDKSLVRIMNFPGSPGRDEQVASQVRQTLGVGNDHVVACRIVRNKDNQYTVLATSMPSEMVERFSTELSDRGLKPVSLVHRGIALANLAEKAADILDAGGDTGVLYADVDSSLLVLRVGGRLALIRQLKEGLGAVHKSVMDSYGLDQDTATKLFNSGSFDISSQSSPFMANWVHQVELSLDFIERRQGGRVRHIFLCGSSLGINILRPVFELDLQRPVEVLPALKGFDCPVVSGRLAAEHRPVSPYLLAACEAYRTMGAARGVADEI